MSMEKLIKHNIFRKYSIPTITFLLLTALYLTVLPAGYTDANNSADGGDLLSAILTNGIPHPTGYPTYLILGKLFHFLPFGTPYTKGALLSLIFSSLAAALVSHLVISSNNKDHSAGNQIAGFAAGFSLGISPLFWSQAVIVEVYGLQSFFVVCTLLWLRNILSKEADTRDDIILSLLSLVVGLSTGNHIMIALFIPAIIFTYLHAFNNKVRLSKLLKYSAIIIAALILVYATLPLRAGNDPLINWGNPKTMEGFFWLVSGKIYHGLAFGVSLSEFFQRTGFLAKYLIDQFSVLGVFIGVLGFVQSFNKSTKVKWIYLWTFIAYTIFSLGYLTNDSVVYLIPPFIVFSILIGSGIKELWKYSSGSLKIGRLIVILFFLFVVYKLPATKHEVDPRGDDSARLYAEQCLNTLPDSAILITESDADTFPIWYYHFGLGQRADIRVIVDGLLPFDWYRETVTQTYPDLSLPTVESKLIREDLARLNPNNTICYSEKINEIDSQYRCMCE